MMQKRFALPLVLFMAAAVSLGGCKKEAPEKAEAPQTEQAQTPAPEQAAAPSTSQAVSGEALFKQHCEVCHANGGNIINPKKPLHAKDLAANGITKPEDIIKTMRNPGPGMTKFDEAAVPDKEATAIAEYVMTTFK